MINEEFSNEFDILANSYSGTIAMNFDEYEKSVFLTKAQEEIVKGLYTGKLAGESLEGNEQIRRYLDSLIKTEELDCNPVEKGLSANSKVAALPKDVWFITYESATLDNHDNCLSSDVEVIPTTQDEYHRIKNNPFRGANNRRVLRLELEGSAVELISPYNIRKYTIRYLSQPDPIILTDLPSNLTINNKSEEVECKLNPGIHRTILELAVSMAIKSKTVNTNK